MSGADQQATPDHPLYVAVDIGCIECGEPSAVLGIFTDEAEAVAVAEAARVKQQADWHGQHGFEVFRVEGIGRR